MPSPRQIAESTESRIIEPEGPDPSPDPPGNLPPPVDNLGVVPTPVPAQNLQRR